jgi:hypothetical protein
LVTIDFADRAPAERSMRKCCAANDVELLARTLLPGDIPDLSGGSAIVIQRTLIGLLGMSFAWSASAAAPPVKPNPAAVDAVALVFLGPEPDRERNRIRARQAVEVGALRAPHEKRTANVLLTRGLTGLGVQRLLAPRRMDVVSFEAKVPTGEASDLMTVWLGSRALMFVRDGSVEDLIDKAIGHERFEFQRRAVHMDKETAAQYRAIAFNPEFAVYRIEVVGTREALFSLSREPLVSAVLVNESEAAVTAFETEKAEMASQVIFRGPTVHMGPAGPQTAH